MVDTHWPGLQEGRENANIDQRARFGEMLMRLTLSVIKADVGSFGGHTKAANFFRWAANAPFEQGAVGDLR